MIGWMNLVPTYTCDIFTNISIRINVLCTLLPTPELFWWKLYFLSLGPFVKHFRPKCVPSPPVKSIRAHAYHESHKRSGARSKRGSDAANAFPPPPGVPPLPLSFSPSLFLSLLRTSKAAGRSGRGTRREAVMGRRKQGRVMMGTLLLLHVAYVAHCFGLKLSDIFLTMPQTETRSTFWCSSSRAESRIFAATYRCQNNLVEK